MDFRQLEYVITIAQEHTLLAAAEKLYLSPSALSQHISRLEEELHTPLFKRTRRGWIPTYAGEVYIDMAGTILGAQKRAYLQISDISDNKAGRFTVGIYPGRGTSMFSAVFPRFKSAYPNVKVGLFEGTVLEISERLASGKVDVGFLTSGLDYPGITLHTQMREDILLVVPRSHPLAARADRVPPGELASVDLTLFQQDEFLLAGEGTTLRTLENRMFSQAGFTPKIAFETASLQTIHQLSRGGYGVAFIPMYYAEKTDNAVYFRPDPPASWELVAAYRRDHYLTRAEEHMIALATEYFRTAPQMYPPSADL